MKKYLAKINQGWYMTWVVGQAIAVRELKWWERIIYWKRKNKSNKKKVKTK
jgi:hypothetical protein